MTDVMIRPVHAVNALDMTLHIDSHVEQRHEAFALIESFGAATDSEILAYDAIEGIDLGYSVLEFRQTLRVAELTATFDCITTIVWKRVDDTWRWPRSRPGWARRGSSSACAASWVQTGVSRTRFRARRSVSTVVASRTGCWRAADACCAAVPSAAPAADPVGCRGLWNNERTAS